MRHSRKVKDENRVVRRVTQTEDSASDCSPLPSVRKVRFTTSAPSSGAAGGIEQHLGKIAELLVKQNDMLEKGLKKQEEKLDKLLEGQQEICRQGWQSRSQSRSPARSPLRCFSCEQIGHIASQCPKQKSPLKASPKGNGSN